MGQRPVVNLFETISVAKRLLEVAGATSCATSTTSLRAISFCDQLATSSNHAGDVGGREVVDSWSQAQYGWGLERKMKK